MTLRVVSRVGQAGSERIYSARPGSAWSTTAACRFYCVLAPGGQLITGLPNAAFVLCRYPADPEDAREMIKCWYTKGACREDINTYLDLINYVFRDQDDHVTYAPHHWPRFWTRSASCSRRPASRERRAVGIRPDDGHPEV